MQFFHVQFQSEALKGDGEFGVFLPNQATAPYKVLWLLHGAFSEYGESIINSSIARYAESRGMAVVCPSSYLGVYTDMIYGENGYSFVKEVVEKAPKLFKKLSTRREDNFLMGISMGGHGSFKLAMEFPERFYGAAAFSSPIDMVYTMTLLENGQHGGGHELFDAFGSSEQYSGTVGDVLFMAEQNIAMGKPLPRLSLCWGDNEMAGHEDSRIEQIFRERGIPLFTKIAPGGHNFDTWDPLVPEVLDYISEGADTAAEREKAEPDAAADKEKAEAGSDNGRAVCAAEKKPACRRRLTCDGKSAAQRHAAVLHFRGGFPSLGVATRFTLVLPDLLPEEGCDFPLLFLPGDEGRDAVELLYSCDLCTIAEDFGTAAVLCEGLHSDYEDMVRGMNWNRYLSEGLPQFLTENFPISGNAIDRRIFGFGMGGLGAVRMGLRRPGFAAAFGACDTDFSVFSDDAAHTDEAFVHRMQTIYGDAFRALKIRKKSDPFMLVKAAKVFPRILLYAGTHPDRSASMIALSEAAESPDCTFIYNREAWQIGGKERIIRDFLKKTMPVL